MKVKIVNKSKHSLPSYETLASAGMDLRANLDEPVVLKPLERALIPTGLYIELPVGYEAQIRPRSGLAIKKGITLLNTPGTVDADYRGEIKIILANISNDEFVVNFLIITQLLFISGIFLSYFAVRNIHCIYFKRVFIK